MKVRIEKAIELSLKFLMKTGFFERFKIDNEKFD